MNALKWAPAGLMTLVLVVADTPRAAPDPAEPVLILYVGAEDCAPCRAWRRDNKPAFLAAMDESRLRYREVIAPKLPQVFEEHVWPEDLRQYRAIAERKRGVPLWLVVRDGRIVTAAAGASLWRSHVLPLVMRAY